jgi:hypothetical protein
MTPGDCASDNHNTRLSQNVTIDYTSRVIIPSVRIERLIVTLEIIETTTITVTQTGVTNDEGPNDPVDRPVSDPGRESRSERPHPHRDAVDLQARKVNPNLRGEIP